MKKKRLITWIYRVLLGLFLLLLLPVLIPFRSPADAVLTVLPLGWWHFLQRNLTQMTCNWNLIAMVPLALALDDRPVRGSVVAVRDCHRRHRRFSPCHLVDGLPATVVSGKVEFLQ